MKNLILIVTFCFSIVSVGQDKFNESIIQLGNDLEYFPVAVNSSKNYNRESLVVERFKNFQTDCFALSLAKFKLL